MDGPSAQRTRPKTKLQHPSKARKENDNSKGEVPSQTSSAEEVVKPFAPTVKLHKKTILPTSPLDGSDVSLQCDSDTSPCNPVRVFMATTLRKRCEHTSSRPGGSENIFCSPTDICITQLEKELAEAQRQLDTYQSRSNLNASQSTNASKDTMQSDTSLIPVRTTRKRFIFPIASKKNTDKAYKRLDKAMSKVSDKVHLDQNGKR
jgi:hypothetical protein